MDKELGQRDIYSIANQPLHAGGIFILPCRIDWQYYVHRPSWNRAGGQQDCVSGSFIASTTPVEHPGKHGHIKVGIVVHSHFAFAVMETMQSAHILRNCSGPGNRQREKESIKTGIIKPFPD